MLGRYFFTLEDLSFKSAISNQVNTYKWSRNYIISYILVDYESEIDVAIPYLNDLGIVVNQTAKDEHVPEIDIYSWVLMFQIWL